jgi:hypothetical protein
MRPEDLVPSTQPVVAQNETSSSSELSSQSSQSNGGWGMSTLFGGWRFMAQAAQQQAQLQQSASAPTSQPAQTTITELSTEEEHGNSGSGDHNK